MKAEIILGIDLGTTNSCISIWKDRKLLVIPDENGNTTIPSVVAFSSISTYVGFEALKQIKVNPRNTIYEVKRLIGKKYSDECVQNDIPFLTYHIVGDEDDEIKIQLTRDRMNLYTPEEISSLVLLKLRNMATQYLGQEIDKVIITVPAHFNELQRQATKVAARMANLDCLRIMSEPVSACLAYGLEKKSEKESKNVLVYDLGGGTLDVSLIEIDDGVFQVLGSGGNTHLGGSDFDNKIMEYCLDVFRKQNPGVELKNLDSSNLQKLKRAAENAKKILSELKVTQIVIPDFCEGKNLSVKLTRVQMERECEELFNLCLDPVDDVLRFSGVEKEDIDEIILVGGATRMPRVRMDLSRFFNGKEINGDMNPDEVISMGAAIQGYMLSNPDDAFSESFVLLDTIPLALGLETQGGVMDTILPRNTTIPVTKKRKYTSDSDYQTSVDIKVFEGERKLTKDNFLIGDFQLAGLESKPRGHSLIEITFQVDSNGIINVTALDLKNELNRSEIKIRNNINKFTDEDIARIVKEGQKFADSDKIDKIKRKLQSELDYLCSAILCNIQKEAFGLGQEEIENITREIEKEKELLAREIGSVEKDEFYNSLERIRTKYVNMIQVYDDKEDLDGINQTNIENTNVFNDEDGGEEDLWGNDINFDLKKNRREIQNKKDILFQLCDSLQEMIESTDPEDSEISLDDLHQLKEIVEDTVLWLYVKENLKENEIDGKIEEINQICNDIFCKNNLHLEEVVSPSDEPIGDQQLRHHMSDANVVESRGTSITNLNKHKSHEGTLISELNN